MYLGGGGGGASTSAPNAPSSSNAPQPANSSSSSSSSAAAQSSVVIQGLQEQVRELTSQVIELKHLEKAKEKVEELERRAAQAEAYTQKAQVRPLLPAMMNDGEWIDNCHD